MGHDGKPRVALGIDPGTAITGYGVVTDDGEALTLITSGTITTRANEPLPVRLKLLYEGLSSIVGRFQPQEVAVEALFFNKNIRSALWVGHARGVALLVAADRGLAVSEYTPLEVKKTITGYGRASKEQIQRMLPVLLNTTETPDQDDAADAVAIAICHLHLSQLARTLGTLE